MYLILENIEYLRNRYAIIISWVLLGDLVKTYLYKSDVYIRVELEVNRKIRAER